MTAVSNTSVRSIGWKRWMKDYSLHIEHWALLIQGKRAFTLAMINNPNQPLNEQTCEERVWEHAIIVRAIRLRVGVIRNQYPVGPEDKYGRKWVSPGDLLLLLYWSYGRLWSWTHVASMEKQSWTLKNRAIDIYRQSTAGQWRVSH